MNKPEVPGGTIHKIPSDIQQVLSANAVALMLWYDITPLARNEWICWVEGTKLVKTRERRVTKTRIELLQGKRRPRSWAGCSHRKAKARQSTT